MTYKKDIPEYFRNPIFTTESKSSAIYFLLLPPLIWILFCVLSASNELLWTMLIFGILVASIIYLVASSNILVFKIYADSLTICCPYFPFRRDLDFSFKSIRGLLFDSTDNHRAFPWLPKRYNRNWIAIHYINKIGEQKVKRVSYYYTPKGDLRKAVSILRESGIQIKDDEIYLRLT